MVHQHVFCRFSNDLETMVGKAPGIYWKAMWKFIGPAIMFVVFMASIVSLILSPLTYHAYNKETVRFFTNINWYIF